MIRIEIQDKRGAVLDYYETAKLPEKGDKIGDIEVLSITPAKSVIFKYVVVCG